MEEFLFRKFLKKDTLKCVRQARLNPQSFEWSEENSDMVKKYVFPVLKHRGSNFYFKFDLHLSSGEFRCRFSPGSYSLVEISKMTEDWDTVLTQFRQWLRNLKEVIAPDPWAEFRGYAPQEPLIDAAEISNIPFSNSEAENIIGSLDKLQAEIEKNFDLQADQLAFVKREIEYLKEAAKRQGRKDWMHTSIGVIITIAAGLALSPEKTKLLWALLKSCFAGLLQLPAP
jgi:hypothetical protein